MNILITGATGFIGSFIVEEALRRNMNVWVAVRSTSSRKYLTDERINFLMLDFDDTQQMVTQMQGLRLDYVVHAAGLTKCVNPADFHRVNTEGTRHLVEALLELKMPLRRFVYLSSLSVCGAVCEKQPYSNITEDTMPHPNTEYGKSKLQAEHYLGTVKDLPYIVLRPTGVYGPRERDYFLMVKSIMGHTDFMVGYEPQTLTFVYVDDIVRAAMNASTLPAADVAGNTYAISDGEEYSTRDFSDFIIDNITRIKGRRQRVVRLTVPLFILKAVCAAGEMLSKLTNKLTALNRDKYNILSQRDWRCDITPARTSLRYKPQVKLAEGVRRTVEWYFENKWI